MNQSMKQMMIIMTKEILEVDLSWDLKIYITGEEKNREDEREE